MMRVKKIKRPIIDGIQFSSGEEGELYEYIRDGKLYSITNIDEFKNILLLNVSPKAYSILPSFNAGKYKFRALEYTPDFIVKIGNDEVVLEYKSKWTASKTDYQLRKKLFLSSYKDKLKFAELIKIKKGVYEFKKYY